MPFMLHGTLVPPRHRVLVVDDEPLFARAVARAMRHHADVVLEWTGAPALERIAQGERFDLILCDVALPGLNGAQFFERLREIRSGVERRLVFVTGGGVAEIEAKLRQTGRPCLRKPITGVVLISLLDRREAQSV
jgi:CheY-like chemotaxis protein